MNPSSSSTPQSSSSVIRKNATLTIRLIRSFTHRNMRPLVLREIDLSTTTCSQLRTVINNAIVASGVLPPPFKKIEFYNAMKLETDPRANNAKSSNALINTSSSCPVIRFDGDDDDKLNLMTTTLEHNQFTHECDVSYFNWDEYLRYLADSNKV